VAPTLARIILSLCAAPYVVMIFIDGRLRPPDLRTGAFAIQQYPSCTGGCCR